MRIHTRVAASACFGASIVVFVLSSGCAASSTSSVVKPLLAPISRSARVLVAAATKDSAYQEEASLLETELERRLNAASRFAQVDVGGLPEKKGDILVDCEITAVRRVGTGVRLMLGAFAGQARVDVHVDIVKISTGEVIAAAEITGKGSGGTIFSGTTPQAVEKAANGIVQFITSAPGEPDRLAIAQ